MHEPETVDVVLADACGTVPLEVKRVRNGRRVRLVVTGKKTVELRLPVDAPLEHALQFVQSKSRWLRQHLDATPVPSRISDFLREQGWLALGGEKWLLQWEQGVITTVEVLAREKRVRLTQPSAGGADGSLADVLWQLAAKFLPARLQALARLEGLSYQRCSVRNQRSRWGSCSARKTISLNWRLILLEPELQDYVLWHELCHLLQMNHAAGFWQELTRVCPQAEELDRRLSVEGSRILNLICEQEDKDE